MEIGRAIGLAAAALTACSHGDHRDAERSAQVATCVDAIEKAGAAGPGEQVRLIARGCTAVCPGLTDWVASRDEAAYRPDVFVDHVPRPTARLIAGCRKTCAADPDWSSLVTSCPDLLASADPPPSDEAFVLSETARWLERETSAGLSDPQLPIRLEHVASTSTFTLPLPPIAVPASRFRTPTHARQFVSIGDELRIGALPEVRLRGGRLEVVPVPGGYPGQRVELDQVGAVLAEHADLLARLGGAPSAVPLVMARGDVPVARVIDVITRLGVTQAEVAVAGEATFAHPVLLERRGMHVASPEIDLEPGDIKLHGFGDDRVTDWAHLDGELDNFAAMNAPVRALELHALPDTTVAELVKLLDACVIGRVSVIQFAPAGP